MICAHTGVRTREVEGPLVAAGVWPNLMRQAAYGLARASVDVLNRVYGARVLVLAGSGNNGGDGLYAGVHLLRRGARVGAVLVGARAHQQALSAFVEAGGLLWRLGDGVEEALERARGSEMIIDAILGTGARGGLTGAAAELVAGLAGHPGVIAADVPSGVSADTGEVEGPVLAAHTAVSFGGIKAGLLLPPGEQYSKQVHRVDLGLALGAPELLRFDRAALASAWPWPEPTAHKYTRGVLGVVAGSARYPGAAQLAVCGALAAGVGVVRYFGPDSVASGLPPEVVRGTGEVADAQVDAWLVGPGVVDDDQQLDRCREVVASGVPTVADAGAFAAVPAYLPASVVLTPHAGELRGLFMRLGVEIPAVELAARPLHCARQLSLHMGATVLLKGATTLVVSPTGALYSQAEGTGWLATAGSGDTLAGIIGSLLAAGVEPARAAAMGASVHGRAGRMAAGPGSGGPITATALAHAFPRVIADLRAG